jgi:hypothetical protein
MRNRLYFCWLIPSIDRLIKSRFFPGMKIALTLIFFVFSLPIFAQKFEGGLLAGFNGSQVRGNQSYGFHKLGFVGGVWIQTDINDKFFWSGELKYNQKGSRINPSKLSPILYINRLNYIDIPVLIGYKYKDYLSFFAGFSFGYLLTSKVIDNYGVDPNFSYNDLHSYEIGMFVGAKVNFNKLVERDWASKLILDLRYQYSAMSIYNLNKLFYSPYGRFNSLISTSLYYTIDFGNSEKN